MTRKERYFCDALIRRLSNGANGGEETLTIRRQTLQPIAHGARKATTEQRMLPERRIAEPVKVGERVCALRAQPVVAEPQGARRRCAGKVAAIEGAEMFGREHVAFQRPDAAVAIAQILEPDPARIRSRLRDAKAVPLLIPFTGHKRQELARGSLGSLMRLTAADLGNDPKSWTEWWVKNSDQPREKWLIDGLRRKEPLLRAMADEELRALSGMTFQFTAGGDKKQQEPAIR